MTGTRHSQEMNSAVAEVQPARAIFKPKLLSAPGSSVGADAAGRQLARYLAGDEQAFAELVGDHQRSAYVTAWRVLGDGQTAHDCVREAFLRVLHCPSDYHMDQPFRPWLLHIVRILAIDSLRQRGRALLNNSQRAAQTAVPSALEGLALRVHVAEVLDELRPTYRDILIMRELEGLPVEEITALTGFDVHTTRRRLHHARLRFREVWLARFGTDGAP